MEHGATRKETTGWKRVNSVKTSKIITNCKICNIPLNSEQSKYCSVYCCRFGARKITRPSIEQLLSELENSNYVQVGKKYGVTDNAVRKWLKQYRAKYSEGSKNAE